MVTIGADLKKVPGARVVVVIDSNTYAVLENFDWEEDYREIVEAVGGTPAPLLFVGHFLGVLTAQVFYTTDLPADFFGLSSGDLTLHSLSVAASDSQGTPVTKTGSIVNARCFKVGRAHRKDNGFRQTMRFAYPVQATWA